MTDNKPSDHGLDDQPESKTQRKKRMTALQDMGEELLALNARQLSQIDLPDNLSTALKEYQRLPNRHEAKRRQLQFIGKLMRNADHESIRSTLDELLTPNRETIRRSQEIERWSQRLLDGSDEDIQAFLNQYPAAERQELRHLLRRYNSLEDETARLNCRRKLINYVGDCIQR